jgi:hypothetical protein
VADCGVSSGKHRYALDFDIKTQELRVRFERYTRQLTTSANDAPQAARTFLMFSRTNPVCLEMLPRSIFPVTGSKGVIPETKRNFPSAITPSE